MPTFPAAFSPHRESPPHASLDGCSAETVYRTDRRKFMSCSHCQELCQQESWLLIGWTRVNNQSEAS